MLYSGRKVDPSAFVDSLTGMFNRAGFEREFKRIITQGKNFSIMLLDIDYFKSVNDAFGHLRGDKIISEVAHRIKSTVRKNDIIARFGGDEFVIVMEGVRKNTAEQVARRIVDSINSAPFGEKAPLFLSVSIGLASFPEDIDDPGKIFELADQRLYAAKRLGRNRLVSSDEGQNFPVLVEIERPIEREEQIERLRNFVDRLGKTERAVLTIAGLPGTGRSFLLTQVVKFARLKGINTINLIGNKNSLHRPLSTITDAISARYHRTLVTERDTIEFLINLSKDSKGLLIAIDDYEHVDSETIHLIKRIFLDTKKLPVMAIAYVLDARLSFRRPFLSIPVSEEYVFVPPLSPEGTKIMLRTLLQWEAPDEFVLWIHEQTGGLPALIKEGVNYLIKHGMLNRSDFGGWELDKSYINLVLRDQIGFHSIVVPNNLPEQMKNFLGRENELRKVEELLEKERLITIVGIGGIGKTRLSLQVATELMERFPDGVFFVQLAPLQSHRNILPAIADAVGFTFRSGEASVEPLAKHLEHKHMLLVLDNFEHVKEGAFTVKELIEKTTNLKIIVTSREPLKIDGEQIFELSGLELPPENSSIEGFVNYSSVQLFIQTARKIKPDFSLNEDNARDIVEICRMLDGLPLGIELATSWLRVLDVGEIIEEIRGGFHFLHAREQDRPERHRSLYAAFIYLWKLLNEQEKLAFSKLSVFHGGFTREAARYVSDIDLSMLGNLIDRVLVERYQKRRYKVHEALRQFGEEKLKEFDNLYETTIEKHRRYFSNFVQKLTTKDPGWSSRDTSDAFEGELGNIMAAWSNAIEAGDWDTIDGLLHGTYMYFLISSRFPEGVQLLTSAIQAIDREAASQKGSLLEGKLKTRLGMLYGGISNMDMAEALLKESVAILRENQGDEKELAFALSNLVYTFYMEGKYREGEALLDETMKLARKHNLQPIIGKLYNTIAIGCYHKGEFDEAVDNAQKALEIFESIGYVRDRASVMNTIGSLMIVKGKYEVAERVFKEIIEIYTQLGDRKSQAIAHHNLGVTYKEAQRLDEALGRFHEALNMLREIGEMHGVSVALNNIGGVLLLQGKPEKALNYLWGSIEAAKKYTGNLWRMASALENIGQIELDNKDIENAKKHFIEALKIACSFRTMPRISTSLYKIAALYIKIGKTEDAYFLLNLVLSSPSMSMRFIEEAERKLKLVEKDIPPDRAKKIRELAKEADWDSVIQKILNGVENLIEL